MLNDIWNCAQILETLPQSGSREPPISTSQSLCREQYYRNSATNHQKRGVCGNKLPACGRVLSASPSRCFKLGVFGRFSLWLRLPCFSATSAPLILGPVLWARLQLVIAAHRGCQSERVPERMD